MLHSRNRNVIVASALSMVMITTSLQNAQAEDVGNVNVEETIIGNQDGDLLVSSSIEESNSNSEEYVSSNDVVSETESEEIHNVDIQQDIQQDGNLDNNLSSENVEVEREYNNFDESSNNVSVLNDDINDDINDDNDNSDFGKIKVDNHIDLGVDNHIDLGIAENYINNSIVSAQQLDRYEKSEEEQNKFLLDNQEYASLVVPSMITAAGVAEGMSLPRVNDISQDTNKIIISNQNQFNLFLKSINKSWKTVFDQIMRHNINFEHIVNQYGTQEMKQYVKNHYSKKNSMATVAPQSYSKPVSSHKPAVKSSSQRAVDFAKSRQGTPYVYGGTTDAGYDCSGFTQAAYRSAGVNIPRTAAEQASYGRSVSRAELQPGDLIFYGYNGPSSSYHTAMYIGDGKVIHSPQSGDHVRVASMNMGPISSMKRPS